MPKMPSMSSKALIKLLEKGGAVFARQGPTDHAIYARITEGKRYSAPVQMGKKCWILCIVKGYSNSCSLQMRKLSDYSANRVIHNFMIPNGIHSLLKIPKQPVEIGWV